MSFLLFYFSTALLGQVNFHILIAWVYYAVHFAVQLFHQLFKTPIFFAYKLQRCITMYGVIKIFKQRSNLQKFWRQRWLTFYSIQPKVYHACNPTLFSLPFKMLKMHFSWAFFKPCFRFFHKLGTASQMGLISLLKMQIKSKLLSNTNCLSLKW